MSEIAWIIGAGSAGMSYVIRAHRKEGRLKYTYSVSVTRDVVVCIAVSGGGVHSPPEFDEYVDHRSSKSCLIILISGSLSDVPPIWMALVQTLGPVV